MSCANEAFQAIWSSPPCGHIAHLSRCGGYVTCRSPTPSHRWRRKNEIYQTNLALAFAALAAAALLAGLVHACWWPRAFPSQPLSRYTARPPGDSGPRRPARWRWSRWSSVGWLWPAQSVVSATPVDSEPSWPWWRGRRRDQWRLGSGCRQRWSRQRQRRGRCRRGGRAGGDRHGPRRASSAPLTPHRLTRCARPKAP